MGRKAEVRQSRSVFDWHCTCCHRTSYTRDDGMVELDNEPRKTVIPRPCERRSYCCVCLGNDTSGTASCAHCFDFDKHESLLKTLVNWHDWWFGILRDLTVMTGVNLFSRSLYSSGEKSLMSWYPFSESTQADAQIISKDVSRYLSKYVSKGARSESTNTIYHPASWWGVDRETRREARRERVRLSIGGYPLELIQSAYARAKTMLRDCSDAIFAFANPYFQAYGGEVAFIPDGKELSLLAGFVDYLSQNGLEYCLTTNI